MRGGHRRDRAHAIEPTDEPALVGDNHDLAHERRARRPVQLHDVLRRKGAFALRRRTGCARTPRSRFTRPMNASVPIPKFARLATRPYEPCSAAFEPEVRLRALRKLGRTSGLRHYRAPCPRIA